MPELNELFTWVPVHQKIANWLKDYRNRQPELIAILKDIGVTGFNDENSSNEPIELTEIDPFTFFCYLYKYGSEKRLLLLQALSKKLNIEPIPTNDHGIPSANAQKVCLFPFKKDRNNNEIGRLWDLFFAAVDNKINDENFSDVLKIRNVGRTKLTECLFDINPNQYFPLNGPTREYLRDKFGIDPKFDTYSEYLAILDEIKENTSKPFYEISYDAWKYVNQNKKNTEKIGIELDREVKLGSLNKPLNIILYGPPGTGKTYNTVNKALELIGVDIAGKSRNEILNIYKKLRNHGQIEFITFHQSMSYEDFIEGIKPDEIEGKISYSVKDGIFKKICIAALTPNEMGFIEAYNQLVKDLSDRQNEPMEVKTQTGKTFGITLNSNDNLNLHTGQNLNQQGSLKKENIQKFLQNDYKYEYWDSYFKGVTDLLKTKYGFSASKNSDKKNYVLIIDEINRGNISQIFGELITLIEEDKRLGQEEALEVLLPYSREKFGVPSNLYILATMNTADRSVEALDAALRRRFSFEFMPPVYDLNGFPQIIDGVDISELLKTINIGISYLLDEDHQIGHSYFMKVRDKEGLRDVFKKNVIPLLKEYFYNDLGKIYMILGEKFVDISESIPYFAGGSNDEIERTTYHINEINDSFPIIEAVKSILEKKQ